MVAMPFYKCFNQTFHTFRENINTFQGERIDILDEISWFTPKGQVELSWTTNEEFNKEQILERR